MTPSSKLTFSSFSLCLSLFVVLHIGVVEGNNPVKIKTICEEYPNYQFGSPFESNLKQVMSNLVRTAPSSGYASSSVGFGADQVRGLALCKFGMSSGDCTTCLSEATTMVVWCKPSVNAIIWYDNCMVKYAGHRFLGQMDRDHKAIVIGSIFNGYQNAFYVKLQQLLYKLAGQSGGPSRFAKGEVDIGGGKKMYGSTQCTRDLSGPLCVRCLYDTIEKDLGSCCAGTTGGRVLGASCHIRFELYPF